MPALKRNLKVNKPVLCKNLKHSVYQVRSPEGHKKFCEMCDEVFDIEMAPRDHLHPEYVYEETGVFLLRKEKKKQ
ncbi:hypothetical protein HN51_017760 [Arachis hypogaea]